MTVLLRGGLGMHHVRVRPCQILAELCELTMVAHWLHYVALICTQYRNKNIQKQYLNTLQHDDNLPSL